MFFYIFLYYTMHNYIYLRTNKGKNIIKITIRFINPIFVFAFCSLQCRPILCKIGRSTVHCTTEGGHYQTMSLVRKNLG